MSVGPDEPDIPHDGARGPDERACPPTPVQGPRLGGAATKAAPGRKGVGRPSGKARTAAPATIRTPFGAALPAALWSAAVGLAAVTILVVLGWAAAPDGGTPPSIAVASGGQAWLLVHGADLTLADGTLSLTPLGLLLLPVYVLARSGAWAARAADVRSWADAARTAGLLAVIYALAGLAVALAAVTPSVRPQPWSAVLCTGFVGLVAGGYGVLRGSGLLATLPSVLPPQAVPVLKGALGAVAVMVAGGALVVAVSLVVPRRTGRTAVDRPRPRPRGRLPAGPALLRPRARTRSCGRAPTRWDRVSPWGSAPRWRRPAS